MSDDNAHAVAWDPIPRAVNIYLAVGVIRFEQYYGDRGMPVSVTVAASTHEPMPRRGTWRIDFQGVAGYRFRPLDREPSSGELVYPEQESNAGAWEIVHSRWLQETVSKRYLRPGEAHHYVITDLDVVYEIAALTWTSEPLDETAADLEQSL